MVGDNNDHIRQPIRQRRRSKRERRQADHSASLIKFNVANPLRALLSSYA